MKQLKPASSAGFFLTFQYVPINFWRAEPLLPVVGAAGKLSHGEGSCFANAPTQEE